MTTESMHHNMSLTTADEFDKTLPVVESFPVEKSRKTLIQMNGVTEFTMATLQEMKLLHMEISQKSMDSSFLKSYC